MDGHRTRRERKVSCLRMKSGWRIKWRHSYAHPSATQSFLVSVVHGRFQFDCSPLERRRRSAGRAHTVCGSSEPQRMDVLSTSDALVPCKNNQTAVWNGLVARWISVERAESLHAGDAITHSRTCRLCVPFAQLHPRLRRTHPPTDTRAPLAALFPRHSVSAP